MNNSNLRQSQPPIYPLTLPLLSNPEKLSKGIFGFFKADTSVFRLDIVFPNAGIGNSTQRATNTFCGDLLMSGTANFSAQELNEQLDFFGAYTSVTTNYFKTVMSVYGLERYFDSILHLITEAVNHSNFPEEELEILKKQKIQNLRIQKQKTTHQSTVLMNKLWYGENSILGKTSTEEDYSRITREMVLSEFKKNFSELFVILTSSPELKSKVSILQTDLGDKLSDNTNFAVEKIVFTKQMPNQAQEFFELPNTNQTSFRARLEVIPRTAENYVNIAFLNLILGGYFGSRLMKNIREDKGWTYGISSSIINFENNAYIEISGDINIDKAKAVKEEIFKEFEKLCNTPIDKTEFENAKNYYLGNLQSMFDEFLTYSERQIALLETKQTLEWYNLFGKQINELKPENIRQAAQNYLDSKSLIYTWSGPNP